MRSSPQTIGSCLLVLLLLFGASPLAIAGGTTITNLGKDPAFVRTKALNGDGGFVVVDPGQTVTLDENVERIRANGNNLDLSVEQANGFAEHVTREMDGKSILVKPEAPLIVVRNQEGTSVLPAHTEGEIARVFGNPGASGANTGIGLPPSPTDGPIQYVGQPLGQATVKGISPGEEEVRSYVDAQQLTREDLDELGLMGIRTDREIYDFLHTEMGFYWYWSGSGGMFGDTVGVASLNSVFHIGNPRFGPTIGRDVGYNRIMTKFNKDTFLENTVNNNFDTFASNFRNLYGDFQEDTRGDSYAG